tara:strand:+ start:988 stop:1746 length:759 start_codon:yes stop_codon:yes gene_type:complete
MQLELHPNDWQVALIVTDLTKIESPGLVIGFDLDYTLLRLNQDPLGVHQDVLKLHGIEPDIGRLEEAYEKTWEQYMQEGYKYATQDIAYHEGIVMTLNEAGVHGPCEQLAREILTQLEAPGVIGPYPDAHKVLEEYSDAGIPLILVTGRWHDPSEDLRRTGLDKYFQDVFYAGSVGHQKDSIKFWRHVMRDLEIRSQELIVVDDSFPSVCAARQTGAKAFLMERPDSPLSSQASADLCGLAELTLLIKSPTH